MAHSLNIALSILAGGQSRRMGQPKALLPYQGKPLIEHLIQRCQQEVKTVMVAGCPEPGLYSHLSVPVLADALGEVGPLGGIHAALRYVNMNLQHVDAVLCIPCDGVQLPRNFIARMSDALQQHEIVFAQDSERKQHLYCLLRCDLQQPLMDYIHQGGRKVIDWFESRDYAVVDFSDNHFYFSNLNTPHDWQQFIAS